MSGFLNGVVLKTFFMIQTIVILVQIGVPHMPLKTGYYATHLRSPDLNDYPKSLVPYFLKYPALKIISMCYSWI